MNEELRRDTAYALQAELVDPRPERLALAIARIAYPDVDMEEHLRRLDVLAAEVEGRLAHVDPGEARAQAFLAALCDDLGFAGNADQYYAADNSYLNVVLTQRTGLPIMLSLICMAIGERLGLSIDGLGFPGHFMARYRDVHGEWLLDAFHNRIIAVDEAERYLAYLFRQPVQLSADAFTPVTPVALALRILNNLRNVYLNAGDPSMALLVMNLMLVITPDSPMLWQEMGVLAARGSELDLASRALRRYFFLTGQFDLVMTTEEVVSPEGRPNLPSGDIDRQVLQMLEEVESMRSRLN